MVVLGKKYRDRITGFEGIATGRALYISGCAQVLVAPAVMEDGAFRESQWFDEQRLTAADTDAPIVLDNSATPGPDKQAPKR